MIASKFSILICAVACLLFGGSSFATQTAQVSEKMVRKASFQQGGFRPIRAVKDAMGLVLPTNNDGLLRGKPKSFYMYTDRHFEGKDDRPWTGGKYGFVRNQRRTDQGIVFTRFHEGIDIAPMERDANGKALDRVHAIAKGKVVYCNKGPGSSSYGRYVVVEHDWGYGLFYSLYAHLAAVETATGRQVNAGDALGVLGYSGRGLNKRRSHLHLELNFLLSNRFSRWHDIHFNDNNHHGKYNGMNMIGLDIAGLLKRHHMDSSITIPDFISRVEPYFAVTVAQKGELELLRRYPWLGRGVGTSDRPVSWEITLSRAGIPLKITGSDRKVSTPEVTSVKKSKVPHSLNTRFLLKGSGEKASLSSAGTRFVQLLSGGF